MKLSVIFAPDDHADLALYTELYRSTYGEAAAPADLVPFIVRSFAKASSRISDSQERFVPFMQPLVGFLFKHQVHEGPHKVHEDRVRPIFGLPP